MPDRASGSTVHARQGKVLGKYSDASHGPICMSEQGRFETDVDKLKREQIELATKQRSLQTNIVRGNEQMEQFKLVMNWNQEEFEQWDAASKQKEDDNMALEKYARQDEARIKDLTLNLEKASKEAQTRRRELENEITETQASAVLHLPWLALLCCVRLLAQGLKNTSDHAQVHASLCIPGSGTRLVSIAAVGHWL